MARDKGPGISPALHDDGTQVSTADMRNSLLRARGKVQVRVVKAHNLRKFSKRDDGVAHKYNSVGAEVLLSFPKIERLFLEGSHVGDWGCGNCQARATHYTVQLGKVVKASKKSKKKDSSPDFVDETFIFNVDGLHPRVRAT